MYKKLRVGAVPRSIAYGGKRLGILSHENTCSITGENCPRISSKVRKLDIHLEPNMTAPLLVQSAFLHPTTPHCENAYLAQY